MAVLKRRGGVFSIDFRFAGRRFRQSLKTDNERAARNAISRADEILRRLELGQLSLPPGADVATFILSDGRIDEKKKAAAFPQLGALLA